MIIPLPTTINKIFKQYLNILNPVLPNKLSPTEIEVFSKFLLIQSIYSHLTTEQIGSIAFHPTTKKSIRQSIKDDTKTNISEASFNNQLLSLRKKKFLIGNTINHKPFTNPEGNISLTFNLNLV